MFLKRVELLGFKSFADRTIIEFRDGITALLGPNGCGKSNVVDAVKWVLGEQSSRNMRAEKMEDVIFNGTESRKALNVAEVTLVISNENGTLELDMPEIAVKRRLYRSGESEYLVNNAPVKLKELRELFFDTGIGKSAYSIMEQGRIDQVLSNKPEERRYIFEEAAGITKFKVKAAEAERRLKRTEENMVQVGNIMVEVKRNHDTLEKQTKKTEEYRRLKDTIFDNELALALFQYKNIENKRLKKKNNQDEIGKKQCNLEKEIGEISGKLENFQDSVSEMEKDLVIRQEKLFDMDLEREKKENRLKLHGERQEEIKQILDEARTKESQLLEKRATFRKDEERKISDINAQKDNLQEIEKDTLHFQKSLDESGQKMEQNRENKKKLEQVILELESEREEWQENLSILTGSIVDELDSGLKDARFSPAERKKREAEIGEKISSLIILLEGRLNLLEDSRKGAADYKKLSESTYGALETALNYVREAGQLFDKYSESFPRFIDDFLSSEGIITQKRQLDENLDNSFRKLKESRLELENSDKEYRQLEEKQIEIRKALESLKVNKVRVSTQIAASEDALKSLKIQADAHELLVQENLVYIKKTENQLNEISGEMEQLWKEQKELDEKKKVHLANMEVLRNDISLRSSSVKDSEDSLKSKRETIQKLKINKETLAIEMKYLAEEIDNLKSNFRERHSRNLESWLPDCDTILIGKEEKEIREAVKDTRQLLKSLGQVNLMAPEEYREVKERYEFLKKQLDDLKKAKEDLSRVTGEIKKESEELFSKTYEEIRQNFHQMFRSLFGGGRGEFKLTDPDHLLESGIEIYAQPPGKKLENISLLSGGEKSLTGVALLFATYLVKPSPFCILDEIDAALDEANIQRFINVLGDFARKSQFVVISHNKKTVAGASTLLGVTMQESGVSRLIAIRLENDDEDA